MNEFLIKVILSFLVAGIWITAATVLAERLGSKLGGLFANLPSTILISFVFIGLTQGVDFVVQATDIVPTALIISSFFVLIFIWSLKRSLPLAILLSLIFWFILAWMAKLIDYPNLSVTIPLYLVVLSALFYILEYSFHIPSQPKNKKRYTFLQLLFRAGFSGGIVASAVITAKLSGPFWAGLLATFPALMFSTMVILTLVQSRRFAQATGKVLMLSGTNILIYAIAVRYTYPILGLTWGTIISFLIAFLWILSLKPFINKIT